MPPFLLNKFNFMKKKSLIAFIVITMIILFLVVFSNSNDARSDFTEIDAIPQRKAAFIAYLKPTINDINQERADERNELTSLVEKIQQGESPGFFEEYKLEKWAKRYDVEYQEDDLLATAKELLIHLDQIPLSIVLAQAAMESAWGTSRFATEGNNFFGQWCYTEGCGIVPGRRSKGLDHEVRVFDSPEESIASYFQNINSHPAYEELRERRLMVRIKDEPLTGYHLLAGLHKYSQRGEAYIDELRSVIRYNKLDKL